jgi:LmbE family N-acetylglucosaminyl deacetylase
MKKILVLAPHTDDAEIGCGGTMARMLEEGAEVFVAAFSTAEESLPPGSPPTLLRDEFHCAMDVLSVPRGNRFVYDYRVRYLESHRQEVLEELVRLKRDIEPDTVLLPSGHDVHQDHQVVHIEGLRAFRDASILGYELPRNHITFSTHAFCTLEERHLDLKWAAMQCYKSQITLDRSYFSRELIDGLARVRGLQVDTDWAEAFQAYRVRF